MKRPSTRVIALTALIAVLALAASCGSDGGTGAPTTTASSGRSAASKDLATYLRTPDRLPDWPAVEGPIPADMTVYFMSGGDGTSALVGGAIRDASTALQWTYKALPYDPANRGTLNSGIQAAVDAGADAVVFTSGSEAELAGAITAAKAKGVALVQIGGSSVDATGFTAMVDNAEANAAAWGKMLGAAIVADAERAGEQAHVGIVSSTVFASLKKVNDALGTAVKGYCGDCTVQTIDVPASDLFSGQASKSVVSAIQRDPKLNYIEFTLGVTSSGVRAALNPVGYSKVKVVGMIPTTAQMADLQAGGSSYWLVIPNRLDGWIAVDAIVRAKTGDDPTIHNREAEPVWILGQDSTFDASTLPELDIDYPAFFGRLWGVD